MTDAPVDLDELEALAKAASCAPDTVDGYAAIEALDNAIDADLAGDCASGQEAQTQCSCRAAPMGSTFCDSCKHDLGCPVHNAAPCRKSGRTQPTPPAVQAKIEHGFPRFCDYCDRGGDHFSDEHIAWAQWQAGRSGTKPAELTAEVERLKAEVQRLNPFAMLYDGPPPPTEHPAKFISGVRYYLGMLEDDGNWSHELGHIEVLCGEFQKAIYARAGNAPPADEVAGLLEDVLAMRTYIRNRTLEMPDAPGVVEFVQRLDRIEQHLKGKR